MQSSFKLTKHLWTALNCNSAPTKTNCLGVLHSCEVSAMLLRSLAPLCGCRAAAHFCLPQMLNLFFNKCLSCSHGFHPLSNWFILVISIIVLGIFCALPSPSFKERHCAQISARPCPLANFRFITPDSRCLDFLVSSETCWQTELYFSQKKSQSFYTKIISQAFHTFFICYMLTAR